MSNRQARREQSRATRSQRTSRPSSSRSSKPSSGGSGPNIFSRTYLLIAAGVIIALAVVFVVVAQMNGGGDDELVSALNDAEANFPFDMANGDKVGSDDAPLKMVEFEDVQCPFCLRYTANQEPTIVEEYVKSGKLQIQYQHLPILGQESTTGAIALTCAAEQNKFWQLHNKLFTVQAEAGQSSNEQKDVGRFSDDKLRGYAEDVGMDLGQYDACYQNPDTLTEVQDQLRTAQSIGFSSTPSFLLNGQILSQGAPSSLDDWRKILDDAYTQATTSPTPGASPTGDASATPAGTGTPPATGTASPAPSGSPSPAATGTAKPSATGTP